MYCGNVPSTTSAALRAGRPDEEDFDQRQAMRKLLARIGGEAVPPLLGRFRLIELLGSGSHGQVYEAWDLRLQRRVALKVLAEPDDRGLHEARALAQVDAPGVVRIHELVEDPECTAVVMQFVQGRTVDAWARTGDPGWRTVVARMADVADALHRVHEAGIVHGDVKPSNIVVGDDGVAVLIDFSLAGRHEELDGPAGTPRFMAPEARRERPTTRSDQFSFFATLRALLQPAPSSVAESTASSGSTDRDRPAPPRMPRALATIVARGTAEDSQARFATMREAARALRGLLARRRRAIAMASLGAVVLGAWGWTTARDARCDQVADAGIEQPVQVGSDARTDVDPAPVVGALDDAVRGWSAAAREQCETHPWTSLPAATPNPCLEAHRRRLVTLADALQDDPVRAVAHGDALLSLIPDVQTCTEDPLLREAGWSAEVDRDALLQTRDRLDRARLALEFEPERAATLLTDAESNPLPPCTWRPDLRLLRAKHAYGAGDVEQAVEHSVAAAVEAETCERDALQIVARAQAASHLVKAGRTDQAADWLRLAAATLQRVPTLTHEAWRLDYGEAELAYASVRLADAHRSFAAAEQALREQGRPHALATHQRIVMMGLRGDAEAEAEAMRFVQAQTERWGASHPAVAEAWGLHGTVLTHLRRLDDATPSLRRSLELWSQWSDEFVTEYRSSQLDLGVALQVSEPEEAAELLQAFVAFAEEELPDSGLSAEALVVLGRVEWRLGEETRALKTTRRAVEVLTATDGPRGATTLQARALEGRLVGVTGDPDAGVAIACEAARVLHEHPDHPPAVAAGALLSCLKVAQDASDRTVRDLTGQTWVPAAVERCEGMSMCRSIARVFAELPRATLPSGGTP